MKRMLPLLAAICIALAALLGGAAPFGRVALSLGMPGTAASLFTDPGWVGVALYRADDFQGAADAMEQAGADAFYNLGNAHAQLGEYAAALEAYDLAVAIRQDPQAQQNFDLLRAFYASTTLDVDGVFLTEDREGSTADAPIARGDARASGTGDEVTNTSATPALAEIVSRGEQRVRQVFDAQSITANARWLATLEDVPGAFLAERIYHEHKARRDAGTGQEQEDTEW